MSDTPRTPLLGPTAKQWLLYLGKAAILGALLFGLARLAPSLPSWGIALAWAALSALTAIGYAYPGVVKKLAKQHQYVNGGLLARINSGRMLGLIAWFVLAAVSTAGLLFEVPAWEPAEWIVAAAAVPVFALAYLAVHRLLSKEYAPAFRTAQTIRWACGVTVVLLLAVYLAVNAFLPAETYATTMEAVDAASRPYADSPSTLVREGGELVAMANGVAAMGLSATARGSIVAYLACRGLLVLSTLCTLAGLASLCTLGRGEIRMIFAPLQTDAGETSAGAEPASENGPASSLEVGTPVPPRRPAPLVKRFVAIAACLPLALVVAFTAADHAMAGVAQAEGYQGARAIVRQQVGVLACIIDGVPYDYQAFQSLTSQVTAEAQALSAEAQAVLVPLINASFDARVANVDSYLDWYYSLSGDYETLANLVLGTAEEFAEEQFTTYIEAGIDDTELNEQWTYYLQSAAELQQQWEDGLAACKIEGAPEWLIVTEGVLDPSALTGPVDSIGKLTGAAERLGIVAVGGVAGGAALGAAGVALDKAVDEAVEEATQKAAREAAGDVVEEGVEKAAGKAVSKEASETVAKTVLQKATGKQFFKTIVEKIAAKLAGRATGEAVGGAVGGAVGTAIGPAGTVVGAAIGAVAGAAIGVGIDYAVLAVDEWQHRDDYRAELVDAIEEERAEMLAAVQG